ncbi:MAG: rhombosortase [Steroidobacteraceae bacterium]
MTRTVTPTRARNRLTRWLASVNGDGWRGWVLLVLVVALMLSGVDGDTMRARFGYERADLAAGELWRLLTAHGVHLDLRHAALNALGLLLMWALFARDFRPRRWLAIVVASIVAIDAGLWFLAPRIEWYVGASGWLHGVMAAGTLAHVRRRDPAGWILAAFLAAKLAIEQQGALPLAGDMPVVVQAHLYGALGGLAAALCLPSRREPL